MTHPKNEPSKEVDQSKVIDDKVAALRARNFEDKHIRKVTQSGADGQ
jgi:hypothetical protein